MVQKRQKNSSPTSSNRRSVRKLNKGKKWSGLEIITMGKDKAHRHIVDLF